MIQVQPDKRPKKTLLNPLSRIGILGAISLSLPGVAQADVGAPTGTSSNTTTISTTNVYSNQVTPVTDQVNDYATTIIAQLGNGTSVFTSTNPDPVSDPTVQAAISTADSILTGDGQTPGSPVLESNQLTLQSSVVTDVQTGPPVSTLASVVTTTYIGPMTIYIGTNQSNAFIIEPGGEDIDTLLTYDVVTPINAVTTNTYLTSQTYLITGSAPSSGGPASGGPTRGGPPSVGPTGGPTAAPLPATVWQGLIGLGVLVLLRLKWAGRKIGCAVRA